MARKLKVGDLIETTPVRTVVRLSDLSDRERATELLEGFLVTEDAARVLESFLGAVERGEGGGFFLQGNFGSGKSHTLAVLARALSDPEAASVLGRRLGRRLDLPPVFTVAISLVEHDARERLEDIVADALTEAWREFGGPPLVKEVDRRLLSEIRTRLEEDHLSELKTFLKEKKLKPEKLFSPAGIPFLSELVLRLDLPYRITTPRKKLWDNLRKHLGAGAAVILMDELSEFLRSKADAASFQEDIRYLQFLGERAAGEPLLVLATLQEWIEETGELKQETFQKIKDRYPVRFRLSGRHVEELVTKRLVRKKKGAEKRILEIWNDLSEAFGETGFPAEKFTELYPVHPGTLRLLDNLRPLFSQSRGIVDFIHYRIAGDPVRGIPGMLEEPAATLLTADHIFDHFEFRIREIAVYRPYVETVYRYFVREAERIFPDEKTRLFALRALKVLILSELSPEEKKPTCRDLTRLLVNSVTDLDPEANYDFVIDVLSRMEREGAYLERIAGPRAHDDVFRIRPQADLGVLLKRKTREAAERLNLGDPRLTAELVPLLEEGYLPLARFSADRGFPVTVRWQGTRRRTDVYLCHLASLTPEDTAARREEIESGAVDMVLVLGAPAGTMPGIGWYFHKSIL